MVCDSVSELLKFCLHLIWRFGIEDELAHSSGGDGGDKQGFVGIFKQGTDGVFDGVEFVILCGLRQPVGIRIPQRYGDGDLMLIAGNPFELAIAGVGADKHRLAVALSRGDMPVILDRQVFGAERLLFLDDVMGNLSPGCGNRARLDTSMP